MKYYEKIEHETLKPYNKIFKTLEMIKTLKFANAQNLNKKNVKN
jgi:hypothetical protein